MYYKIYVQPFIQRFYLFPLCFTPVTGVNFEKVLKEFLNSKIIKTSLHYKIQGLVSVGDTIKVTKVCNNVEEFPQILVELLSPRRQINLKNLLNESTIYIEVQFSNQTMTPEEFVFEKSSMPIRFLYQQMKLGEGYSNVNVNLYAGLRQILIPIEAGIVRESDGLKLHAKELSEKIQLNLTE